MKNRSFINTHLAVAACICTLGLYGCSSKTDGKTDIFGNTTELYGYVRDASGTAMQGVVVSDGYTCTATDAAGRYTLDRNPSAYYVYYSIPADCRVEVDPSTGLPLFYQRLSKSQSQYDFTLTRQPVETKFRMLAVGDPQVTTTAQVYRFEQETVADIKSYVETETDLPTYAITLGDIVGNKWELYPNMVKAMSSSKTGGIPVFQTIGNHDHEFPQVTDVAAQRQYESCFGPVNYSFTRGDVHFVSMDDIIHGATASDDYKGGFLDWQYEWLKQDLSYVPKDKMVILCIHIPFRNSFSASGGGYYDEVLALLAQFREAHVFAAHTHNNNTSYVHTSGSKRIREHIVGTSCGAWWHGTICTDGAPNGYGIYEFDGTTITNSLYKGTRCDESFQIRLYNASDEFTGGGSAVYRFGVTGENQVVANIWNADERWTFDVYENGVKSSSGLKRMTMIDAWAKAFFYGYCKVTSSSYGNSYAHMYYYTRTTPGSTVRVVARDSYGNEFEQSVITSTTDYPNNYY